MAVAQTNIKRMLAYSSIAHAGYILVGLLAQNAEGHAGVLFYVLAYTFMNLGAFGILILLSRRGEELVTLDDLQGLAHRQPLGGGDDGAVHALAGRHSADRGLHGQAVPVPGHSEGWADVRPCRHF